jgi:hypothetical protein
LSESEIGKLKAYEEKHRGRKTLIEVFDRRLEHG